MDKLSLKILDLFYNHEYLSVDNISTILHCDIQLISASCLYLRNNRYIHTDDITQTDDAVIYPDSFYAITVKGKAYFEKLNDDKAKDYRELFFKIGNFTLSVIAIIISIIALLKQ